MRHARTIWMISKYASSGKYGFESRIFALARRFRRSGRTPVIISSDSNHLASFPRLQGLYNREEDDGIEAWWIRTLRYRKTASIRRILSWLDFEIRLFLMPKRHIEKPDVIIVSSLSLLTILNGVWLKRRYQCRLIFEVRDIWPLTLVAEGGFSKKNPLVMLFAWIERYGYRRADLIIGTMPNLQAHVKKVTGDDLPCHCIPFGFDPAFYDTADPLPEGFCEQYFPEGKFLIAYAGSIGLSNALETLVACARRLADDERFFFLVVGDGDMRNRFISETSDLPNIAFAPKVGRSQVQSVLQRCDLLYFAVYNSEVWNYGMSLNKLIDYMMAARPVVASYSGYQSMINEAGCGEFVPSADVTALADALRRYAALPSEQLAAMGKAGRKWLISHRSWDVLAQEYLAQCDLLLAQGHARV